MQEDDAPNKHRRVCRGCTVDRNRAYGVVYIFDDLRGSQIEHIFARDLGVSRDVRQRFRGAKEGHRYRARDGLKCALQAGRHAINRLRKPLALRQLEAIRKTYSVGAEEAVALHHGEPPGYQVRFYHDAIHKI